MDHPSIGVLRVIIKRLIEGHALEMRIINAKKYYKRRVVNGRFFVNN